MNDQPKTSGGRKRRSQKRRSQAAESHPDDRHDGEARISPDDMPSDNLGAGARDPQAKHEVADTVQNDLLALAGEGDAGSPADQATRSPARPGTSDSADAVGADVESRRDDLGVARATPAPSPPLTGREQAVLPRGRAFGGVVVAIVGGALRLIATTLLVFGLVGAASYFTLKYYISGHETKVPNVCGVTLDEALEKLKPSGLLLELDRREYSEAVPRGNVIAQFPSPGVKVKTRTPVRVVLSDGAARVPAPNLAGQSEINAGVALRAIAKADLDVGARAFAYSAEIAKGGVIAQDPPAGTPVLRGSRINLLISLGPPPVYYEMPDLADRTLQEARIALGEMQLTIAEVREDDYPGARRGIVVTQQPRPGQRVSRADPITLTIATGMGDVPLP